MTSQRPPAGGPVGADRTGALRRKRLGDLLIDAGLVTAEQLAEALTTQGGTGAARRRLGQTLVDLGFIDERTLAVHLADQLGLETVDLSGAVVDSDTVRRLPQALSERHGVCLIEVDAAGRAVLAMADPTNVVALDDVRVLLRTEVLPVVGLHSQIQEQLRRAWSLSGDGSQLAALAEEQPDEDPMLLATRAVEDSPTVKLVDQILRDAVTLRASDIHVEVQRESLRIRYRIDGLLRDVLNAPRSLAGSVVSRLKIMSGLDISERRVPQDGRSRITVGGQEIDTRVSTLPSLHGEKVVIRILARGDAVPSLEKLGFEPDQLVAFRTTLGLPQGLILITGPTGSGKTNTLYAGLGETVTPDINIVTLEDPIEVQLPGITQVQVNPKTGMTFQAGLRSVLRQDPDIVLVGEIRDGETTELALKAAMTGHLVLSTLHTNSAVAAITRLVDMGADPYLVASSLALAIAQRLVRTPCAACARPYRPAEDTLALLGLTQADVPDTGPRQGAGCSECGGTGYRGRTAVYEVLEVDAAMRKALVRDPSEASVSAQARRCGMRSLRASALLKAMDGRTTFEEVLRVTTSDRGEGDTHGGCPACGRPVDAGMSGCPWCGTTLRQACTRCDRGLDDGWIMCPWCRHPVEGHDDGAVPLQGRRARRGAGEQALSMEG